LYKKFTKSQEKMKNKIESKKPMTIWISGYDKNKFEEPFLIIADKVEFNGNELHFSLHKELIFKVWLKLNEYKKYKNINEALKDVGINIIK